MALAKRKARPEPLFVAAKQLTPSAGHPFNQKLNQLLDEDRVDAAQQEDSTCWHCDHSGPRYAARFGPTTLTRARRLADASVDPTEARNGSGLQA